ncbi:hypothetical protein HAX54_027304, partial [Datura stramonium]|nr:hypothetical protein [Datura stramonium]
MMLTRDAIRTKATETWWDHVLDHLDIGSLILSPSNLSEKGRTSAKALDRQDPYMEQCDTAPSWRDGKRDAQ